MKRREALVGVLGGLGLAACSYRSTTTTRSRVPMGEGRAGARAGRSEASGARASAGTSATPRPSVGEAEATDLELEVKPVSGAGSLAPTTGHCDLDGVLAARGSAARAWRACERDRDVERALAEGLRVSTASHRQSQGRAQHLAGHPAQARLDYEEAIRQDTDGRNASAVSAFARINLGLLHHEQGDQAAAEQHLRWVLQHSTDPAVRGAAYHNLSLVLLALERTDEALDAAQRGHRLLRQALGEGHGSVGAALNALGVIHAERGELDEAIDALEAAVDTRALALGDDHPATAASYTNLGVALGRRGDWEEALLAHQQALSIDGEVLGPDHATTAADQSYVGAALLELGRPREARACFEQALAILEPERPIDDPEVEQLRRWLEACDEAERVVHQNMRN